jgi:hypothetical protein
MKKREVRVINAPVWVFCAPLGSNEGGAVVVSIRWVLNSPGSSSNSNAVIVPQCGAGEKLFLRGICVRGNGEEFRSSRVQELMSRRVEEVAATFLRQGEPEGWPLVFVFVRGNLG